MSHIRQTERKLDYRYMPPMQCCPFYHYSILGLGTKNGVAMKCIFKILTSTKIAIFYIEDKS